MNILVDVACIWQFVLLLSDMVVVWFADRCSDVSICSSMKNFSQLIDPLGHKLAKDEFITCMC